MMDDVLNTALREVAETHIQNLARRHKIHVRRTKDWMASEADHMTRQIFIPRVFKTGLDYLVALHEIGHLVDTHAEPISYFAPGVGSALRDEAAAWAWAVEHARPEIVEAMTKTDWRRVGHCWVSSAGSPW
jgi:hypothetical protein